MDLKTFFVLAAAQLMDPAVFAGVVLLLVAIGLLAGALLHRRVSPGLGEYRKPSGEIAAIVEGRWEFLREEPDGEFRPCGELVPEGEDPHVAVSNRSRLEGVSYGARLFRP